MARKRSYSSARRTRYSSGRRTGTKGRRVAGKSSGRSVRPQTVRIVLAYEGAPTGSVPGIPNNPGVSAQGVKPNKAMF